VLICVLSVGADCETFLLLGLQQHTEKFRSLVCLIGFDLSVALCRAHPARFARQICESSTGIRLFPAQGRDDE
jgi:hypothetical protein